MQDKFKRGHVAPHAPGERCLGDTCRVPRNASHRAAVLVLLLWITAVGSLLFTVWNLFHQHFALALTELVLAGYALTLLWAIRGRTDPGHYALAFVVPLSLAILFGYIAVPLSESIYVWMLAIPVVSYILLGQWLGFGVTVGFFTLAVFISVFKLGASNLAWGPASLNLVVCFLSIAGLAHVYEVVRANTEGRLRASALRDSLTGTFNRTGLNVRFDHYEEAAADAPAALGLILLDLDHFKRINDTYGHHAGDHVLRRVACCIDALISAEDTVGRLGGEEFVVLLPDQDLEQTERTAESIRLAIASSHARDESHPIKVTATLGVTARNGGESLDALLERADARLYCGKLNNRDQVVAAIKPVTNLASG